MFETSVLSPHLRDTISDAGLEKLRCEAPCYCSLQGGIAQRSLR